MVLALALADHAHDDGTHIFPGNDVLAKKTRVSDRTVIRMLKRFVEIGWLIKVKHGNGGRGYATVYRISPAWIAGGELNLDRNKKGDKLTPFFGEGKGDIAVSLKGDTAVSLKGDIAVSPQPSLTINNHQTTPRERAPPVDNSGSVDLGKIFSRRLVVLGVKVTSMHHLMQQWVNNRIPLEFIEQCVELARLQKPSPQVIPAKYLDAIIREELSKAAGTKATGAYQAPARPWYLTPEGIARRAFEIGMISATLTDQARINDLAFQKRVLDREGITPEQVAAARQQWAAP